IGGNPTASGGATPYTYSWSPTNDLSSPAMANPTASPTNTTTYTVVVTDANGCSSTNSSVTGTVDTTAPTITCPTNITVQCGGPIPAADFAGGTVQDDIDPSPVVTHVGDETNGINPQVITRTYKATDSCSNSVTCIQTITVLFDTNAPAITCPAPIVVNSDPGSCSKTNVTFSAIATDNCDTNPVVTFDPPSGSTFPLGVTAVTAKATDAAGNSNTCSFTVTVLDGNPPSITCP